MQEAPPPQNTEQTTPAQVAPASTALQDSAIGGNVHTGDVIYNHQNLVAPKPEIPISNLINIGLICLALIMVSISLFSESWIVQNQEILGTEMESRMGLDDTSITTCDSDGDCESEENDISEQYDECKKEMDEWENSDWDLGEYPFKEYCEAIGSQATAGFVGTIAFAGSVLFLLVAGVLLLLGVLGKNIPFVNYSPLLPGALIFIGFALWELILPAVNGDYGWAAKLTLFSGVIACYVGVNPVLDKIHASNGLASFFSDNRFELISKLKLVWFGLTIFGLFLLFFTPIIGLPLMLFGLLLSFINFADPKLLTEQTEHGEQRMLLLQFGRNHGKPVEESPQPAAPVPVVQTPLPTAPVPDVQTPPPAPSPVVATPPTPSPQLEPEPPTLEEAKPSVPETQEIVEDVDWPEVASEVKTPVVDEVEEVVDEGPEVASTIVEEEIVEEAPKPSTETIPPAPAPPTTALPPAPAPPPTPMVVPAAPAPP
ncbi:MAG: hypothetical protein P8Q39_04620, partial [Candidatus Thalassarchaeaceae archaeon]|nr:hypothetical protein [Candidatus Thalassarchaeaceae archaeon]